MSALMTKPFFANHFSLIEMYCPLLLYTCQYFSCPVGGIFSLKLTAIEGCRKRRYSGNFILLGLSQDWFQPGGLMVADITCNQYGSFSFLFWGKKIGWFQTLFHTLSSLVYRNSNTTILNKMFPQLQKHMETIDDRYMDSYSFKCIAFIYGCHFSNMEEKFKAKIRYFWIISSLIDEPIFSWFGIISTKPLKISRLCFQWLKLCFFFILVI